MKHKCDKTVSVSLLFMVAFVLPFFGCTASSLKPGNTNSQANQESKVAADFVNKVWRVDKSKDVAIGQLYVFLSDGTLVITSPHSKPLIGAWTRTDGALVITEESLTYKVDILKLNEDEFKIRINNPGEATEIEFVPAIKSGEAK